MSIEEIFVDTIAVPHQVLKIRGDGACLFSSLSYLLYGTPSQATQLRLDIVHHVITNWNRFEHLTMMCTGLPYNSKSHYVADMSKPTTYGTTCEIMAAGEMFPYKFQVYQNGELLAEFGEPVEGTKRLKFSGNFMEGHFDVLIPQAQQLVSKTDMPITSWHSTPCILSGPISPSTVHSKPDSIVLSDRILPAAQEVKRGKKKEEEIYEYYSQKTISRCSKKIFTKPPRN